MYEEAKPAPYLNTPSPRWNMMEVAPCCWEAFLHQGQEGWSDLMGSWMTYQILEKPEKNLSLQQEHSTRNTVERFRSGLSKVLRKNVETVGQLVHRIRNHTKKKKRSVFRFYRQKAFCYTEWVTKILFMPLPLNSHALISNSIFLHLVLHIVFALTNWLSYHTPSVWT